MSDRPQLDLPCVEPERRLVGGRMGWAVHRFPIKGGISMLEAAQITAQATYARESFWVRYVPLAEAATA